MSAKVFWLKMRLNWWVVVKVFSWSQTSVASKDQAVHVEFE